MLLGLLGILGPYIVLGADAGNASAYQIIFRIMAIVALFGYGCAWFLYTNKVINDPAKARFVPLFCPAPIALMFFAVGHG